MAYLKCPTSSDGRCNHRLNGPLNIARNRWACTPETEKKEIIIHGSHLDFGCTS